MKKIVALVVLALAVPSLALAAKLPTAGSAPSAQSKSAPKVIYVLKGTLTAYAAAGATSNGSVSISVKAANHHGASLKGQTLTFPVAPTTKVAADNGTTVTVNDNGIVKVRGPKRVPATDNLATDLQALTAFQVIDQGASN
jgi:hypothetical protein